MDLNKESLRRDFSKDHERYYSPKLFKEEGFIRKNCKGCGKNFWTLDSGREFCGDSEHQPYSFMKDKTEDISYLDFWKKFSGFFERNGHTVVEKYPVVSRWRQDLYFTIASIQDFQRLENGKMGFEYSANPLLVPQICMRFNDIPNVGVTGRHMTSFMMAGQHAFNYPKEGYWVDRTIELNYGFLTGELGVKKEELTYIEDVWAMGDFSEFGPCLESFANGLELVNSVFTEFEFTNGKVRELDGKVVDVGWGFERLIWFYTRKQTAYDAVFRKELEYAYSATGLRPDRALYGKVAGKLGEIDITEEKSGGLEDRVMKGSGVTEREYREVIKPMQAMYAIVDHTRTLLFAINDGALPSNMGGGYNLRILLRRVLDFVDDYHLNIDLMKLVEVEAAELKGLFGGIDESMEEVKEVFDVERKRYLKSKESAYKTVDAAIRRGSRLDGSALKTLYESNGITPDFIMNVARSKKLEIEIDENAYNDLLKDNFVEKRKVTEKRAGFDIDLSGIDKTERLFYSLPSGEADATVLRAKGKMVVLDKTPFYAESGGQEEDHGTIGGIAVEDVQSVGGVIIHIMESDPPFSEGEKVHCAVDMERRARLMAHHTATHLVSAAARKVLGKHAWQEGARKSAEKAHIDIAHYEKLSDGQVREIEDTANSYILHGMKVKMEEMERGSAESRFGFSIYQGHGVPASRIRIVEISDLSGNLIDAEACGGLHIAGKESMIGIIKIISSSRIHDGVDRIEFVAGAAAADYIRGMESDIKTASGIAGVDRDKLIKGIQSMKEECLSAKKMLALAEDELTTSILKELAAEKGTVVRELNYGRAALREIAKAFIEGRKDRSIVLYNPEGEAVAMAGDDSGTGALENLNAFAEREGRHFKGGGTAKMAEGRLD